MSRSLKLHFSLFLSIFVLLTLPKLIFGQYFRPRTFRGPPAPVPPSPPQPPPQYYGQRQNSYQELSGNSLDINPYSNIASNYHNLQDETGTSPFTGHLTGREESPVGGRGLLGTPHFGMPFGSNPTDDRIDDQELTPEEKESKKENPVPYFINPFIKRGTQKLLHHEAKFVQNPRGTPLIVRPLLRNTLNPASRISPAI